ncbi:MAG: GDSL-type esterase/lipase family protein [Oscillospiraceae bacterium]
MNAKKLTALVCAVCLCSAITGCAKEEKADSAEAAETTTVQEETSVRSIELKEENFKELGRTYYADGKIYCALSGTGAEFTFTGTECSVTVMGDANSANPSMADNQARVGIYVNGERVVDEMIDNLTETYEVFKSDTEETADIKIVKLSESPMSTFAITDITINGKDVKPAEDKERFIEFIGDSITCGYGVDDEDMNHHFSTKTEDTTKTYAYKTAEALNADYSMVSFSGYGIISGYSDGEKKVSEQTVPQYYTKLGYSWSQNGSFVPANIEWDFSKRQPDVVVINLGTNDDSYCKNKDDRCEEFQQTYVEFLKTIREKNPDSTIICTLGIMGQNLYPYVELAARQYSEETGDENISWLMFDMQSQDDGIAADWHPTEKTHAKASAKLAEKIKEVMGW